VLERIGAVAEADPEREVCGFVVRRPGGALEVVPVRNSAGAAEGRSAFAMETAGQLRILLGLEREGGEIVAVFHSHVEAPAVLSREDREQLTASGAPLWPGVEQLVVSVRRGRAGEVRRYRLLAGDFEEFPLD